MEGKKTKPRALLVFGAPCSGKTTFAEKFANKFDLTYFDLDEAKKQTEFTDEQLRAALGLVAHTKMTLILEGRMDTEEDRRLLSGLSVDSVMDERYLLCNGLTPPCGCCDATCAPFMSTRPISRYSLTDSTTFSI